MGSNSLLIKTSDGKTMVYRDMDKIQQVSPMIKSNIVQWNKKTSIVFLDLKEDEVKEVLSYLDEGRLPTDKDGWISLLISISYLEVTGYLRDIVEESAERFVEDHNVHIEKGRGIPNIIRALRYGNSGEVTFSPYRTPRYY